jgi:hypothetical protein
VIARKRSKIFETAQASLREGRLEGIIDAPKSGRWGDWEYCMLGKTQYCRRHAEREDPGTPAQQCVRDAFGSAAKAWGRKLTQEQREAWNAMGQQEWSKPRLAQRGKLAGQQVFAKLTSVLEKVGKPMLLWPTPRPMFKPNPVVELSIANGSDGVKIKLRVSGRLEEDIMLWGQAACSAGRTKWRHGVYLCLLSPLTGGEMDITEKYVARFGQPEPGKKIFIRTQQQRNGWKDIPKDFSEVVPVRAGKGECGARNAECGMGTTDQAQAASVGLEGLNGLPQSHNLHEVNGLSGSDGLQQVKYSANPPPDRSRACCRRERR